MDVPRYAAHRALPLRAFVPGRPGSARPAESKLDARTLPPERWRENEAWLYGVDLWNHGFLWEAHETWESIWRIPHDAEQAEFLRGMIQCAAACLKLAIGNARSATKLSQAGLERLEHVTMPPTGRYMGLDVRTFIDALQAFVASNPSSHELPPKLILE